MSLRMHFLGRPRFERDGQAVDLTAAKAIALMAYLAASRQPQPRDRLLALLWPESHDEAARKNLRNTLWTLRRALGEDAVHASGDRLGIDESAWVDVRELERIADVGVEAEPLPFEAGILLDGLVLSDAPDYELWLTGERERLGQLYLRVLYGQAELVRERAEWTLVADIARRALVFDHLQEPMHRLLMEAYARMGQRADAIRQYDLLRKTLADELGVDPLPETEAVRTAIANGEYDQAYLPSAPSLPRRPRRQPILGDAPRTPFVGRSVEWSALDAELNLVRDGQSRVVLISGEMGIGKSRLWQEWSANLAPEIAIFEGRCLEVTQTLPFAPLIDLFSNSACVRQLVARSMPLSPIWLAEVARVIPAVRAVVPGGFAPVVLPLAEERQRLFEAFVQLLLALQAKPTVFFIDDLHWVDQTTLDWLSYLVHRTREYPMLILGAYRPEDAPANLARLVAGWGRDGVLRRLPLNRLTDEEASALVASLGGDAQPAQHAKSQSAGNPYFLIELSRAAPSDVPQVLSDLIRSRLDRLPETARQVLQAASVMEPEFDYAALRRTSGRGEEETLDALDALLTAAVLVERGGRYAFAHPLVAAVVREGLSRARRAFLNRRAAEAIEAAHPGQLEQMAARLTTHYAEAGDLVRAASFADLAARRALALAAPAEAVELYRRALAYDPSPERQISLGQALQRSNEIAAARAAFDAALKDFIARDDRRGAARACLELGSISLPSGRSDEVLHWAEASLAYLDAEPDPETHTRAHFLLGAGLSQAGDAFDEAEKHLMEAASLASVHHLPGLAGQSRFELGNLLAQRGDLDQALRAYQDSITYARQANEPLQEALAHNNYAYHALLSGDLAAAHEHIEQALALADAGAIRMPRQYLYSTRGEIALAEQQWTEAEMWFHRGISEAEYAGNTVQMANLRANLGLVAQGRGDLDGALILLESAHRLTADHLAPYLQVQIDLWLAALHLQRSERVAAEQTLRRALDRMAGKDYRRLRAQAEQLRHSLQVK